MLLRWNDTLDLRFRRKWGLRGTKVRVLSKNLSTWSFIRRQRSYGRQGKRRDSDGGEAEAGVTHDGEEGHRLVTDVRKDRGNQPWV